MRTMTFSILLFFFAQMIIAQEDPLKYSWSQNSQNGHQYTLTKSTTWEEANKIAESLGGHLVSINDFDEYEFIKRWLFKKNQESLWIGLTDKEIRNTWKWTSEEPYLLQDWSRVENSGDGRNYVSVSKANQQYHWSANTEYERMQGIVEFPVSLVSNKQPIESYYYHSNTFEADIKSTFYKTGFYSAFYYLYNSSGSGKSIDESNRSDANLILANLIPDKNNVISRTPVSIDNIQTTLNHSSQVIVRAVNSIGELVGPKISRNIHFINTNEYSLNSSHPSTPYKFSDHKFVTFNVGMVSPGYGLEAFYTVDKSPHTIIDNNSKNLLKTDTSTFNIDFTQKPFNTGQS